VDDIPDHELTTILEKRCALPACRPAFLPPRASWQPRHCFYAVQLRCTPLHSLHTAVFQTRLQPGSCLTSTALVPPPCLPAFSACRCAIAPSYAAKLVAVQGELQRRRSASNVFAGRHGFITPRDLFRWVCLPRCC
jgi:hypothetical protein